MELNNYCIKYLHESPEEHITCIDPMSRTYENCEDCPVYKRLLEQKKRRAELQKLTEEVDPLEVLCSKCIEHQCCAYLSDKKHCLEYRNIEEKENEKKSC
jgi:hypothetical protein